MVLGVLVGSWLDEMIDTAPAPAWLARLTIDGTWPPAVITIPVCAVLAVLTAREVAALLGAKGIRASVGLTSCAALVGVLLSGLTPDGGGAFTGSMTVGAVVTLVLVGSMAYYARQKDPTGVVAATAGALFAFAYAGLLLGAIPAIRREHSCWVLAWVLMVVKLSDVGAFFAGRWFGRRKLAPWLSPGKTWEGLGGAVILSVIVAVGGGLALRAAGIDAPGPLAAALCGVLFAVVGHAGDLMASVLKRDAGAKDTGTMVPGFGGILDVLDSILLVGPVAFWALRALKSG